MGKEVDFVRIDFMRIDLVGVDLVRIENHTTNHPKLMNLADSGFVCQSFRLISLLMKQLNL